MKISRVIILLRKFIEKDGIDELRYEFENLNQMAGLHYGGEIYCCKWDNDDKLWHIEYSKNNELYEKEESFETYILSFLDTYLTDIKSELTTHYLNLKREEFESLLSKIEKEFNELVKTGSNKSPQIRNICEHLEGFKRDLVAKYLDSDTPSRLDAIFSGPKIKWMGPITTLSTFLLDYSSNNNNLNKPLMERNIPGFKNLMLNCFTDEKGNAFSSQTVNTYLDTNKQAEKQSKKTVIKLEEKGDEDLVVSRSNKPKKSAPKAYPLPKGIDKPSVIIPK